MKKVTDLKENEVIVCRSRQEAKKNYAVNARCRINLV